MRASLTIFKEAFPIFFIGIAGSLGAGVMLSQWSGALALVPGLALLLPGALGARGTIYATLGTHLGSAMHMGTVSRFSLKDETVRKNIASTFKSTIFVSLILAAFGSGLARLSGIEANPFLLLFITLVSGTVTGIILITFTNLVSFQAFKYGWDPDIISAPLISTFGDFITVPVLLGVSMLALQVPQQVLIGMALITIPFVLWYTGRQIITVPFLVLIGSVTVQLFAGVFLEKFLHEFLKTPGLLVFLPAFLAQGGNLSNFVASRLSTQLHLGTLAPRFALKGNVVRELLIAVALSIFVFPLLALAAFILQELSSIHHISLLGMTRIALQAGVLNTLLVAIALGFSVSILSWRLNLDPDDITIPVLSAIADLCGILLLLLVI